MRVKKFTFNRMFLQVFLTLLFFSVGQLFSSFSGNHDLK